MYLKMKKKIVLVGAKKFKHFYIGFEPHSNSHFAPLKKGNTFMKKIRKIPSLLRLVDDGNNSAIYW